jgi:SPP1 family predicted phage head-tail adaptor
MNAGELRQKLTIQTLTRTPDGYGGYTKAWNDFATTWAKIQPLRGDERYKAQQVMNTVSHKITLRYLDGIKPQMRAISGSRIFNILAVINVEEKNELIELLCEEVIS